MLCRADDQRDLVRRIAYPCVEPAPGALLTASFDLLLTDLPTLLQYEDQIRERRRLDEPGIRPLLLLVSDAELGQSSPFPGALVEDVICAPVRPVELASRIENLLQRGKISTAQQPRLVSAQVELQGEVRALQALCACDERLIHVTSEGQAMMTACSSLTVEGGYALAWVGQAEQPESGKVSVAACAGDAQGYLRETSMAMAETGLGEDPIETVLRTGQRLMMSVGDARPVPLAWQNAATAYGLKSVIVFPLAVRITEPGSCLAIYSVHAIAFEPREIELLQQLVENLVHCISALRGKYRRRRSEQKSLRLTYRDSLTGLASRAAALEALDRHLRQAGPFPRAAGLLSLGLDNFARTNDDLGRHGGDMVLIEVAQRLQATVRGSDLVARLGSDQFLIVAPHETDDGLSAVDPAETANVMSSLAERILKMLEAPFYLQGERYRLSASIGICLSSEDCSDVAALLARASSAMRQSKQKGGNGFELSAWEPTRRQQLRLAMQDRLYDALDSHQFQLVFQPLIDLQNARVVGVEALIRWPQPDGTSIPPAEFIPIAEQSSLINRIGSWVMFEALSTLRRLRERGFSTLQMSVNLAVAQLWQPTLVAEIVGFLNFFAIPPGLLKVELTESTLMSDMGFMQRILGELRQAGINVAIDDFGTGYSSLARLKLLPIDMVKIDRSFLADTPEDEDGVMVINTVIQMVKNLNIAVLAEGIETRAQWHMLRAIGCPLGQGLYFAGPLTEAGLLERLGQANDLALDMGDT